MIINALFLIGIILAIVGWFFDRAKLFNWLMMKIAPDYIFAQKALEDLKKDPKIALTKHHEGFQILLERWPNLSNKDSVEYIGRTAAFVSFGAQVKNDIQLIAYDNENKEIRERWSISNATVVIEEIVERRLFKIGAILFWIGIVVSIASHIISLKTNS